ncbi:AraC family transcriptional regulator [Verrucomicrobium sp. GAS474]|uniref:helix-turn-helix domain-containing protein n=1 Tax=Verrucomicrobium sp. GAS474 TaxID=1882831 RepID=UPI00138FCB88|nr:AraC family transcriptional regulator [Verrucomicrobium sp. GAS474]
MIFQYTYRGRGTIEFGGKAYDVPPGHAFIAMIPEASRYYYPPEEKGEWVFSWINFYGDLAFRLWGGLRERGGPVVALAPAAVRLLEALIARARSRAWRDPYEVSGDAYRFYLEVLRHVRPVQRKTAEPLARAIAHLRNHYQTPLRIKEVAALVEMSREHFTRLFFKQMGVSPALFLRQIRLEMAARLLRTTELPVAEVAFRSGFASATQMGVFFKRRNRLSPTLYRRRNRSEAGKPGPKQKRLASAKAIR